MDRFEALRKVERSYDASVEGVPIGSALIHVAERDGQHLIFTASPAQARYLVVHATGTVRDVGGEHEGITTPWVIQYFGVAQNPALLRTEMAGSCTESRRHGTAAAVVGAER